MSERALVEFKVAVDTWLPKMDDEARREAVDYVIARRAGVAMTKRTKVLDQATLHPGQGSRSTRSPAAGGTIKFET